MKEPDVFNSMFISIIFRAWSYCGAISGCIIQPYQQCSLMNSTRLRNLTVPSGFLNLVKNSSTRSTSGEARYTKTTWPNCIFLKFDRCMQKSWNNSLVWCVMSRHSRYTYKRKFFCRCPLFTCTPWVQFDGLPAKPHDLRVLGFQHVSCRDQGALPSLRREVEWLDEAPTQHALLSERVRKRGPVRRLSPFQGTGNL